MQPEKKDNYGRNLALQIVIAVLAATILTMDSIEAMHMAIVPKRHMFHLAIFGIVLLLALIEIVRMVVAHRRARRP